jgi:predicted metalloprotease
MMRVFGKSVGAAAFAAALIAITSSFTQASSRQLAYVTPSVTAPLRITEQDVAASNRKLEMAAGALVSMWSGNFEKLGAHFAQPGLMRYRGAVATPCGIMRPNNAGYCPRDNNIYFDEVFVAAQAGTAARELGTDGDMAAVGIIAHEMGHAVAIQLGHESRISYENEATADCLAGAFALQSSKDGSLEKGDLEEAFFGMYNAGDPTPELTGNPRMDNRIMRVASLMGHGTREQRLANFKSGYAGGAGACLPEFAGR